MWQVLEKIATKGRQYGEHCSGGHARLHSSPNSCIRRDGVFRDELRDEDIKGILGERSGTVIY